MSIQFYYFKQFLALFIFLSVAVTATAQKDSVRIWGRVCDKDTIAMYGVRISCQVHKDSIEKIIAVTDLDGKYILTVPKKSQIRFSMDTFGEHVISFSQNSKSREYNVVLSSGTELKNINIVAKYIPPKIEKRKTRIRGNHMYIYQPVYIHRDSSKTYQRYMAQCIVTNQTMKRVFLTNAAALDGKEYHLTQERMYGYDLSKDPLSDNLSIKKGKIHTNRDSIRSAFKQKRQAEENKFKSLKDKGFYGEAEYDKEEFNSKKEIRRIEKQINVDTIYVIDTLIVNKNTDFCRTDLLYAKENYKQVLRVDTLFISEGVQYPERFLRYSLSSTLYANENNFPKLDLTPRESEPEKVPIRFHIGKATVDMNDSVTASTLAQIARTLENINKSTEAQLLNFSIHATASPDGNYARNQGLAHARLTNAVKEINLLSSGALQDIPQHKSSEVAKWEDVVSLMQQDSLLEEAKQLEECLTLKNPSSRIAKLPFSDLIYDKYLPLLRSVEYQYTYTFYRELSVKEIKEEYAKNKESLALPHYFKLYRSYIAEKNDSLAERVCTEAYTRFPKDNYIRVVACDLSALRNSIGKPDTTILAPFIDRKYEREQEIFINQVLAYLKLEEFEKANWTSDRWVKISPETQYMKAVTTFMAGYELSPEMEKVLCQDNLQNKIVYLLATDADDQAYNLIKSMRIEQIENAEEAYLIAICYARKKEKEKAMIFLTKAITLKPSLVKTASIDADVIEILRDLEKKEKNEEPQPSENAESEVPHA